MYLGGGMVASPHGVEHCVVFLGKPPYSHSVSLHPRSVNGHWQTVGETWLVGEWPDGLASHVEGVGILQAASHYRNRDKLWQHEPVSSMVSHILLKLTCRCSVIRKQ